MQMSFPQIVVALLTFGLACAVMVVMAKRNLRTAYPLLFSYLGIIAISVPVATLAYRYAIGQYFSAYWIGATLVMAVGFAVQYEVFVDILKPYSAVIDLGRMLFFWAAAFLFFAGLLTALVTSGTHSSKIVVAVDLCDRCVHMMQCGLMLLMVAFEKRLNLSWRSSGMSIAIGLGITAVMDLAISYAQANFPSRENELAMLNSFAFCGVLLFWALRLGAPEGGPVKAADAPSRLIIQRWNDALINYRQAEVAFSPMNSFLPGVEQTVDRVLARKIVQ